MKETELKPCPFCKTNSVYIAVHDDEGNYKGRIGCEYEKDPWSGLSYALHHEGWGECILCTDGEEQTMGGVLFDTPEEAAEEWNKGVAPKSEYEALKEMLDATIAGQETLHKALANAKSEVAREIFEEIEKYKRSPMPECKPVYVINYSGFAELKKKYTEEKS